MNVVEYKPSEARILYYSSLENAVYDLGTTIQLKAVTRVVIIQ